MSEMTVSNGSDFYTGVHISVNGKPLYKITAVSGNTLTIEYLDWKARFYSWLSRVKAKITFFYWDVLLEIEENIEAFKEWRKS